MLLVHFKFLEKKIIKKHQYYKYKLTGSYMFLVLISPLNQCFCCFFLMGLFWGLTPVHKQKSQIVNQIWLTPNVESFRQQRFELIYMYSSIKLNINKLFSGKTIGTYYSCLSKTFNKCKTTNPNYATRKVFSSFSVWKKIKSSFISLLQND